MLEPHTPDGQHRHTHGTNRVGQTRNAGWRHAALGVGGKDRPENQVINPARRLDARRFAGMMNGAPDQKPWWHGAAHARRGNAVRRQVHPMCSGSERHVKTIVYHDPGARPGDGLDTSTDEPRQGAVREMVLAHLNEIDPCACGSADAFHECIGRRRSRHEPVPIGDQAEDRSHTTLEDRLMTRRATWAARAAR
jgi:hypothetical protein